MKRILGSVAILMLALIYLPHLEGQKSEQREPTAAENEQMQREVDEALKETEAAARETDAKLHLPKLTCANAGKELEELGERLGQLKTAVNKCTRDIGKCNAHVNDLRSKYWGAEDYVSSILNSEAGIVRSRHNMLNQIDSINTRIAALHKFLESCEETSQAPRSPPNPGATPSTTDKVLTALGGAVNIGVGIGGSHGGDNHKDGKHVSHDRGSADRLANDHTAYTTDQHTSDRKLSDAQKHASSASDKTRARDHKKLTPTPSPHA